MTMTVWVVVYTLSLCVMLLCGLVWYQTVKARQYLTAYTSMLRSVKIKRAALIRLRSSTKNVSDTSGPTVRVLDTHSESYASQY